MQELTLHIVLIGLTFAAFSNSLHGQWVFDDLPGVWSNPDLRPDAPWSDLWNHDFWGAPIESWQSHKSYRPLTIASFRISYWLTGQDFDKLEKGSGNPLPWHLVNVVVHGIVSLLAMHLFRALRAPKGVPFAGAALFATHPIHTDAVSSIVSRGEMLSAMMFLLSLLCYIHLVSGITTRLGGGLYSEVARHAALLLLSWGLGFAGMLCKEQCITVVAVQVVYDMTLGSGVLQAAYDGARTRFAGGEAGEVAGTGSAPESQTDVGTTPANEKENGNGKGCTSNGLMVEEVGGNTGNARFWFFATRMVFLVSAYAATYVWRIRKNGPCEVVLKVGGNPNISAWDIGGLEAPGIYSSASCKPNFLKQENPARWVKGPGAGLTRLMTWSHLVPMNAWLLVAPLELRADYSEGALTLVTRWNDPRNAVTVAFFIMFLGITAHALHLSLTSGASVHRHCPLLGLSLLVAPFIPSSNMFFPVGFVIAERTLYLPSLGFCLLLPLLLFSLFPHHAPQITASLLAAYTARTVTRNRDWATRESFYEAMHRSNPMSPKANSALGACYLGGQGCEFDVENVERGLSLLNVAMKLEPRSYRSNLEVGHHYEKAGDYAMAQKYYGTAFRIMPEHMDVVMNYGHSIMQVEGYREAAELYDHGVKTWPDDPPMWLALSNALLGAGDYADAFDVLTTFFMMGCSEGPAYRQYGLGLAHVGRNRPAENMLRHSLRLNPRDPIALFYLGDLLTKTGRVGEAANYYMRSFLVDPKHAWQEKQPRFRRKALGGLPMSHDKHMRSRAARLLKKAGNLAGSRDHKLGSQDFESVGGDHKSLRGGRVERSGPRHSSEIASAEIMLKGGAVGNKPPKFGRI